MLHHNQIVIGCLHPADQLCYFDALFYVQIRCGLVKDVHICLLHHHHHHGETLQLST